MYVLTILPGNLWDFTRIRKKERKITGEKYTEVDRANDLVCDM